MISESDAISEAQKFSSPQATGDPVVSILADGAEVVYLIEFSFEDGETYLDAVVDALDGSIVELFYHDIQPYDREKALLWIEKKLDAAKGRARSLALEGNRVAAMRLWRKTFDCSIFEAKAEIDRISHE